MMLKSRAEQQVLIAGMAQLCNLSQAMPVCLTHHKIGYPPNCEWLLFCAIITRQREGCQT